MEEQPSPDLQDPSNFHQWLTKLTPLDFVSLSDTELSILREHQEKDPLIRLEIAKILKGVPLQDLATDAKKSANQPYYKEAYGKEMIGAFDYMEREKKSISFRISKFPQYSVNTLRARINQSIQFLLAKLDPTGKYKELWERIELATDSDKKGLTLIYRIQAAIPLVWEEAILNSTFEEVKARVEWFINEAPDETGEELPDLENVKPFSLTPEQMKELQDYCDRYHYIKCLIGSDKIILKKAMGEK